MTSTATCVQLHRKAERVAAALMEKARLSIGDHVALVYPPGKHIEASQNSPGSLLHTYPHPLGLLSWDSPSGAGIMITFPTDCCRDSGELLAAILHHCSHNNPASEHLCWVLVVTVSFFIRQYPLVNNCKLL